MATFCKVILTQIHCLLLYTQRAFIRKPAWFLLPSLIIFGTALFLARQVQVGIRAEDWLDPKLQTTQQYLKLKQDFGSEDRLTWIVPTPWKSPEVCSLQKLYSQLTQESYKLNSASSIFDLRLPQYLKQDEKLFYPLVLEQNCLFQTTDLGNLKRHPLADAFAVRPEKDFLFHFTIDELSVPTKWGKVDFAEVEVLSERLKAARPESLLGGTLFFQKSTRDGIRWAGKLNILTGLFIILACRIFLGTWLSGVILVGFVFLTTSLLQAGMVVRNEVVDPLSSSLFILMSIAVIEDYFFAFHLTRHKNSTLRKSLRRLLLPGFLTSLTTAFGFGALVTSDNMSVQNLGFWAAFGAMVECGLILWGLPALIRVFPSLNTLPLKGNVWNPTWLTKLGDVRPSKAGVLILTLPLLLIFYTYDKVNINYTPFDMFPSSHPLVQYRDYMKTYRGFEGEISLVFQSPEISEVESKIVSEVAKHPLIVGVKNPYLITSALIPQDADPALKRLIEFEIKDTPSMKTYHADRQSRAILFIRSLDIQSIDALTTHANQICRGKCYLSGEVIAFKDYAFSMLNTLYMSFVTSLVPVLLTMAFLCLASSGKIHWPILLSTIWAPVMLLIAVTLLQVKVNVVTCLAMALLTGLAGDNAIQFLFYDRKARWSKGLQELKHSALMMFFVMTSISSVMLFSYFRSARILSGLIVLGISLLLIGDLWILNHFTAKIEEPNSQD